MRRACSAASRDMAASFDCSMEEGWFEGGEEGAVAAVFLVGASLGEAGDGAPVRAGEETAAPPPALSSSLRDRGLLSLQSPDLPNPAPLSPPAPAEDRIAACFAAARAASSLSTTLEAAARSRRSRAAPGCAASRAAATASATGRVEPATSALTTRPATVWPSSAGAAMRGAEGAAKRTSAKRPPPRCVRARAAAAAGVAAAPPPPATTKGLL